MEKRTISNYYNTRRMDTENIIVIIRFRSYDCSYIFLNAFFYFFYNNTGFIRVMSRVQKIYYILQGP